MRRKLGTPSKTRKIEQGPSRIWRSIGGALSPRISLSQQPRLVSETVRRMKKRSIRSALAPPESYKGLLLEKMTLSRFELARNILAPCGIHCGYCSYFKKERSPHCPGCYTQKGHPFWGECKLFSCAASHGAEHCGLCTDFPCELFVDQYDPEHGQKSAFMRAGLLAYRKKAGTEKYIEMVKKLEQQV